MTAPRRDAISGDRIPRHDPDRRYVALEHITWLLALDAAESVREMVGQGWPVADAVSNSRSWMLSNIVLAVEAGLSFASIEQDERGA